MKIMFLNKAPRNAAIYDVAKIESLLNGYASPGTKVEVCFPDDFAGSRIEELIGGQDKLNGLDHMMDLPALIRKIMWAADNGYDAVIQSNTFDPGVDGGRLVVGIPVLGPFRTTLHAAAILADRIGLTVPLASHVPYTWRIARSYGMDHMITDIRPVGIYGADLAERRDEIIETAAGVMKGLVSQTGAECIIPLGGAIIPYVVDPADLEAAVGVPVFNTKSVTIRFAETCVNLGLAHSPLTYPRADLKYDDFSAHAEGLDTGT
ncbi:MAG: aspartate/glutamate racemase family protein [Alphaproteobacteria bacterium]|nr:aspartate/glutamate racemase family protein [Alphaproteobacteria bacterium]